MDSDDDASAKAPRRPRRRTDGAGAGDERPDRDRPDRGPLYVLGAAIAVAVALVLYETRDTTLFDSELGLYTGFAAGFDLDAVLAPRDGHLVAVASLLYELGFTGFGAEYFFFRILGAIVLAILAVVLYVYVRRRLGAWPALAPVVLVLFLGAAWEALLWPYAMLTVGLALACGIGALLLVERRDRGGDVAACALLVLAVACHSIGLAFCLGVAVKLLWRKRHRRRAWVVLVPLVVYAVWWLWALKFDDTSALDLGNIWLIPAYAANALAVVLAALTGLAATITGEETSTIEIDAGWGAPLALAAIAAFALRLARGRTPIALVASFSILLAFWAFAALSLGLDAGPEASRYILPGAVLVVLVGADALAGVPVPSAARIAVALVVVIGVATGIRQLTDGGEFLRDYSTQVRATAAGLEAAEASVPQDYEPAADPALEGEVPPGLPLVAGEYLEAAKEFDSLAPERGELSPEERRLSERIRITAISAGAGVEPPAP